MVCNYCIVKCKKFSTLGPFFAIWNIYDKSNPDFPLCPYCCYIPQTLNPFVASHINQGFPQGHQYWGLVWSSLGRGPIALICRGGQTLVERGSKILMYVWKLFYLLTVTDEVSPPKRILLLTSLSQITIFLHV